METTKFYTVRTTSLDDESYFDVNEFKGSIECDLYTDNTELYTDIVKLFTDEYKPSLENKGHTCISLAGIEIFDC